MDNAVVEQNQLLREQNELLRQQNELLRQNFNGGGLHLNDSQVFIKNLYDDEMRDGFLVTSHRKKIWNVEIGLINEFARICKKHNLRWFAGYGTLLGAVRHNGFIPWDDDVDIIMFRPDYEKFKKVAAVELHEPYFLDSWQNYRWESKGNISAPDEQQFPLITIEQEKKGLQGWPRFPFLKFRDSRTTFIEYDDRPQVNQGIWLDIFCFDPAPPFTDQKHNLIFLVEKELMAVATFPNEVKNALAQGAKSLIDEKTLDALFKMTSRQRAIQYSEYALANFFESPKVGRTFIDPNIDAFDTEDFRDVIYMPFEEIELPVPIGYEKILQIAYGDWRKKIFTHSHASECSADISYKDYFEKVIYIR